MSRLTAYLLRLFSTNALTLTGVALVLIWLIQCLRIFDLVSVKGQGLVTLAGQAFLTMPSLLVVFFYVCAGIGLARGLRELQASQELHAIHTSRRLPALLSGIWLYAGLFAAFVLLLSNFVEPHATKRLNDWSASIAADLVSRTMTPHRFSQVVPGVVVLIGGRHGDGEITEFFADDRRDPEMRRTYIAKSARIAEDETGYVIRLRDGSMQYASSRNTFSQISFATYDVAMERLTDPIENSGGLAEVDSLQIVAAGIAAGGFNKTMKRELAERLAEGLRVFGMCILVAGLAAFPNARRNRFTMPFEVLVLVIAFAERGVSNYAPVGPTLLPFAGATVMTLAGILVLAYKLRMFRRQVQSRRVPHSQRASA